MPDEAQNTASTPAHAPPSLAGAAWLVHPSTRAVLAALAAAGHPARIVGGAVRNALLGLAVADIDIATPARPDQVIAAAAKAGLHAVPTGIAHGTVTVIALTRPFEVTTLRRDVTTDGRRATVAFTDDWAVDASRRDFTINALYCDADGAISDPVGGCADIAERRVRFIGDANARIAEDYLRILRFFRFFAAYADGPPDAEAMAACVHGLAGMARLSAERIRAELLKLLVAPRAADAVTAMSGIGLLVPMLGAAPRPGVMADVISAEQRLALAPDVSLRLSALAVAVADDIPRLAARLRLANAARDALLVLDAGLVDALAGATPRDARRLVYRLGPDATRRRAAAISALRADANAATEALLAVAATWTPPRLPISGGDLLARGIKPGPAVGAMLSALEAWWMTHDFPDRAAVEAELALLLARS